MSFASVIVAPVASRPVGSHELKRKEKKEKRKIENRGEKRRSVIHTDSVVMKGIETFMISGRTEGVPSIF